MTTPLDPDKPASEFPATDARAARYLDTIAKIARVCHEANRGYQASWPADGIPVALPWDEFVAEYPEQAAGVEEGVRLALEGATPEQLHDSWCKRKISEGWHWGEVKDADAKTHPCLCDYAELPPEQQTKDVLFYSIVRSLTSKLLD